MSDTFTARTGRTVAIKSRSMKGTILEISGLGTRTTVDLGDVATLREFFQHERDKELGRWRWSEKPEFVVYPVGDDGLVDVLREHTLAGYGPGRMQGISRDSSTHPENDGAASNFYKAARAYFAAHPEPKPWHDARDGQLWLIRFDDFPDTDVSALVKGGRFVYNDHCHEGTATLEDSSIVGGTQIWPEVKP